MKLIPIGDKLIVKRVDAETTTAGGIVLPDTAREKSQEGRILSVGDGRMLPSGLRVAPQVQEGDRVIFSSYAGADVRIDGNDVLIMSEGDILAVLQ